MRMYVSECVRACVRGCVGAWVRGCVRACVCACVRAWVSEWVSEWVWRRRTGRRRRKRRGYRTKNKNPTRQCGEKRSNSARLPPKWKVACSADGLVPMCFAIFPVHLSKLLCLPRKSDARSYEVLHLSRKITTANLKIWCLQNATRLRKSAPGPPNSSDEDVSCTAPATENASLQILFKCPTPAIVFGNATKPSRFAHFSKGAQSLAPATRNDIWTSKSGPIPLCFVHFDFEMCFAPHRRALFRHLNFQKWSEPGVLCTFWLRNVLRATTACNFSSLIWPAGSAPAALASLLFDPPEPQIIGKTQCFATFLPFRAPASSFFWLFLFSDLLSSTLLFSLTLPISAFHLSILSEVWLLNFLRSLFESLSCCHRSSPTSPDKFLQPRRRSSKALCINLCPPPSRTRLFFQTVFNK